MNWGNFCGIDNINATIKFCNPIETLGDLVKVSRLENWDYVDNDHFIYNHGKTVGISYGDSYLGRWIKVKFMGGILEETRSDWFIHPENISHIAT